MEVIGLQRWVVCVLLPEMPGIVVTLTVCLSVVAVTQGQAQDRGGCPATAARKASREIAHVEDWKGFYSAFKRMGDCDHGKAAQEYSYAVSRLLAHHWDDVSSLLSLAAADKEFKQFVLRHIDEDMPEEESQAILSNSRQHCPTEGRWLCKAIADY